MASLSRQTLLDQENVMASANVYGKITAHYDRVFNGFTLCGVKSESQINALRSKPGVASIEQDQVVKANALQTVLNPLSWGLDRIDQRGNVLDRKFLYDNVGAPVNVYVLDTGIYTGHSQFEGRAVSGYNFVDNTADASDCNGHGTHVAGTVGAKDYGVCKHCKLIAVKVLGCSGNGTLSGVISGINWAIAHASSTGVPSVFSLSLGGAFSSFLNNAVESAIASGFVTVVAAGNSNMNACSFSPASAPSAITVGAISQAGSKSSYSNFGSCVDIFAPGDNIPSTWIGSSAAVNILSGTSMAAPHVAGIAAVYRSYNPLKTAAEVRAFIVEQTSTRGVISGLGATSPNRLLYYQLDNAILGNIDGFFSTSTGGVLNGWTCNSGVFTSLDVHLYAKKPSGETTFLKSAIASSPSEAAVSSVCGTSGISHRFSIPVSFADLDALNGGKLLVYTISAFPRQDALLANSGVYPPDLSIKGNIDGFTSSPSGAVLSGWVCNSRVYKSLDVHVYYGGVFGVGSFLKVATANVANEPAVSSICGTSGVSHRFSIPLSYAELSLLAGKKLFVYGISSVLGWPNSLLDNSGIYPDLSIKGNIDGLATSASGAVLSGWACNSKISRSIDVHVYYGGVFGVGSFLKVATANVANEPAVSSVCGTSGVSHRFSILLSNAELSLLAGKKLFVYGISSVSGWPNSLLGNSGIYP